MDPSVPAGAARLLDFVRLVETGRTDRSSYDVIYGHNQAKLTKPLTSMTLDEAIAAGPGWTKRFRSSAAGAYQFMNATLKGLKKELGLRGGQVFAPDLQDRLGYHLLRRRGYDAFMAGSISEAEFGKRLAMEWASLPVLTATKGAHLQVSRGQSYYAGDGMNKSLVKAERVEDVLRAVRAGRDPEPKPKHGGKTAGGAVVVGTGAAVASQDDGSGLLIGLGVAVVVIGIIGFVIWRKRASFGAMLRDLKERL